MKTRTLTKYRWVPHTVDGDTELVREPYDVEVPVPPADWDQRVRTALTVGAVILIGVTVVWSTASIGDLLGRVTAPPAAYGAAVAFDLSWIMCQGAEWLFRYDPERARLPRRAGHFALLVAMGAVAAHGYLAGQLVIGGVGAAVSALAKGSSMVAMSVHARPLDPRTLQWVTRRRARYDAKMAMIPIKRDFQRAEGLVEAERRALDTPEGQTQDELTDETPEPSRPSAELSGPAGTPVDDLSTLRGMHGSIVYFLGNGNRVKIGTTRDLMGRISALCLRPSNLLCAFHGGHDIERRFHSLFSAYRVGDSEWFEITGELADFVAQHTGAASSASDDAPRDADDAALDAEQVSAPPPPLPPLPMGASKSSLILAASSMLRPGASAADIAHHLAQQGCAVDTAYVRTVLSRSKKTGPDDEVGRGGGGYA